MNNVNSLTIFCFIDLLSLTKKRTEIFWSITVISVDSVGLIVDANFLC